MFVFYWSSFNRFINKIYYIINMKIAVFTDSFLPNINGVVTSVVNSSKEMAKKGHKILIFTVKPKKCPKIDFGKNIYIVRFSPLNIIKYPDFSLAAPNYLKCLRILKRFRPDIIHIHMPSPLGWCALMASKSLDIPVIGTYHTLLPDFLEHTSLPKRITKSKTSRKLTWKYTNNFYNRCDVVTTPSAVMRKVLIKYGIKKPVIFISNGVNLARFHPINSRKDGKTILHVGRISYEKNIDVLIKSFRILLKKKPDAKLLIAGKGPDMNNLKKITGKLLNKSIMFLGQIEHNKLAGLYSSADIFATASTVETEGLVILEAMACGQPIIGVNKLAIPYIVKHEKNGFIAHPYNEKEIADYMLKLLKDKNLRKKFGKESLRIVKDFSLDNIINKLEGIYKKLIR